MFALVLWEYIEIVMVPMEALAASNSNSLADCRVKIGGKLDLSVHKEFHVRYLDSKYRFFFAC